MRIIYDYQNQLDLQSSWLALSCCGTTRVNWSPWVLIQKVNRGSGYITKNSIQMQNSRSKELKTLKSV